MYTPKWSAVDDEDEIRAMVAAVASGWFVTADKGRSPVATLLPVIWHGERIIAHMAKANPQWREMRDDSPALVIVGGPEAYVSPTWYATKSEDPRVVPTWNYTAVHLSGTVRVREHPEWLRTAVTALTERHERDRERPWSIDDAPPEFVDAALGAIVGIEMQVTHVDAKAKLSQNREESDRLGVIAGLRGEGAPGAFAIADAMEEREALP